MRDLAFELLQQKVNKLIGMKHQGLWIVDENINVGEITNIFPSDNLQVMSNRYDVCLLLRERGFDTSLNDFDFSLMRRQSFDGIYYRVSKEKAVVHHIINSAALFLKDGGQLFISGYKNEGVKTYIKKAGDYLGDCIELERGGSTSQLAVIECRDSAQGLNKNRLDDKQYSALRLINPKDKTSFTSKPGLFGWNKIDHGSQFLIENFKSFIQHIPVMPTTVADLGCGYGYLSVMVSQLIEAEFIAIDNNAAAVIACKKNFEDHSLRGSVHLTDCADSVNKLVDLVICNPPFHQGFAVENDLTLKFLHACDRLLIPGGRAIFVVNSFIPLERKADSIFSEVCVIDNNKRFKLVSLRK